MDGGTLSSIDVHDPDGLVCVDSCFSMRTDAEVEGILSSSQVHRMVPILPVPFTGGPAVGVKRKRVCDNPVVLLTPHSPPVVLPVSVGGRLMNYQIPFRGIQKHA